MSINNFTCYENEILTWIRKSDSSSKIGFEREGLRIRDSLISKESHPAKLGSALCNNYITTDFSEAQLELVTPAYEDKKVAIQFLRDIHHFVSNKLGDEYLWPFSMPINVESDKDILIASYGNSNLAKFKQIYRNGLSERYGKMMQIISGVHYNYSVPESIWKSELFKKRGLSAKDSRSKVYFNMLRNLYRFNWIVIYLFGASPIVSSTFLKSNRESFKELNDDAFYLPYATSLRMSSYGYQNRRRKLPVSLNSIDEYISDLRKATLTSDPEFNQIKNSNQAQISDSILQIDDEYYAIARVKSQSRSEQRTTSKLMKWGVDFIELRSLDLDPWWYCLGRTVTPCHHGVK